MPLASGYLDRMAAEIAALGIGAPLFLMLSNGGLTHIDEAKRIPVRLLESGPAAGALAAAVLGARSGATDLLAFDMGGTTAKLAVVRDGVPRVAHIGSRRRARSASPRAAACRSASPPWSSSRSAPAAAASPSLDQLGTAEGRAAQRGLGTRAPSAMRAAARSRR
jgi:hypothetical protein